jgi:hypothetical protein
MEIIWVVPYVVSELHSLDVISAAERCVYAKFEI